jgi:energy-coupling factor transporter ATP-binding protein EcfA2
VTNDLRHIIVEGPDGSGKDTQIRSLLGILGDHTLHERASTSLGGPVDNLARWVARDVATMHVQPASIYNRHPLISELIYAPYRLPPRPQDVEFTHKAWRDAMRNHASRFAIVVFCQPPAHVVRSTVLKQGRDAHMPGVYDRILDIYADYALHLWPGINIRYDYTSNNALPGLVKKIYRALNHERP